MTTRLLLREMLRRRLEDTSGSPLWDDQTLNGALADGLRDLSARVPAERALNVTVSAGTRVVPVSAPDLDGQRIVRVIDSRGDLIAAARDVSGASAVTGGLASTSQAWRWWAGTVRLDRPALGGNWRIEYLADWFFPTNDSTVIDLPPSDATLVVAMATACALRRRAIEDAKRGHDVRMLLTLATAARAEADWSIASRRRRARGGVLARA